MIQTPEELEQTERIHAEYAVAKEKKMAQAKQRTYVEGREAFRQHILSMSLFPNVYDKKMIMKGS